MVSGKGVYVYDEDQKKLLEGMAGLWCTSLGWGHPDLIEAARAQLSSLAYYHCYGRTNDQVERLTERLVRLADMDDGACFLGSGGSDCNEAQVRVFWAKQNALGNTEKKRIVSRQRAYHGSTVSAGSLTGLAHVTGPNAGTGLPVTTVCAAHARCPHYWREKEAGESEEDFVQRCASELDELFQQLDARRTVCAFIVEPVHGAGGVVVPPTGYFDAISAVCRKYDVEIIADEVITGFGRTGRVWGADSVGLSGQSAISCAKQLTSAYVPLSAAILDADTVDVLREETRRTGGVFAHGLTYSGHPVAAAVANATLDVYERDSLYTVGQGPVGRTFQTRLDLLSGHPLVGECRGIGLVAAVELIDDLDSKSPIPLSMAGRLGKVAYDQCYKHGLILRAVGDALCICISQCHRKLVSRDYILCCDPGPPLIITVDQVHELFDKLEAALDDTLAIAQVQGYLRRSS